MKKETSSEIRVGVFVVVALAILMATVLVLSSKSSLFRRTYRLTTHFANVAGLMEGAEVRLAGLSVGYVTTISFPTDRTKTGARVDFTVNKKALERLPKDSHATIATAGLLGAKFLELVPGDPSTGFVRANDAVAGIDPIDYLKELQRAGEVVANINELSRSVQRIVQSLSGEGPPTDLSRAVTSAKNVVAAVETGPGLAHELLVSGKRQSIAEDLATTVRDLKLVVGEVHDGKSALHGLIYDPQGEQIVRNLRQASDSLQAVLAEIQNGNGTLHGLVYGGGQGADVTADLQKTVANLREITDTIRSGQGTLGALIVDPTLYEDALKITGQVKRSTILKAAIRYVIRKHEAAAPK